MLLGVSQNNSYLPYFIITIKITVLREITYQIYMPSPNVSLRMRGQTLGLFWRFLTLSSGLMLVQCLALKRIPSSALGSLR